MKILLNNSERALLRFDPGEDVVQELKNFTVKEGLGSASFSAIGACDKVTLSYFDLNRGEYIDRVVSEPLEIASVNGNIAFNEDVIVHVHGTFSNENFELVGGHVKESWMKKLDSIYLLDN